MAAPAERPSGALCGCSSEFAAGPDAFSAAVAASPGGVLLLDGGTATELERRGVDISVPLWSAAALLDKESDVEAVHRSYLEAGSRVLTTVSYQVGTSPFSH